MNEILKKIKYSRLKQEERYLIDLLNNLIIYISNEYYANGDLINSEYLYYKYKKDVIFQYNKDSKIFGIDPNIYNKFKNEYHLNEDQINLMIKKYAENYLSLNNINVLEQLGITIIATLDKLKPLYKKKKRFWLF
jgi:hypothetical protein